MHHNTVRTLRFISYRFPLQRLSSPILLGAHTPSSSTSYITECTSSQGLLKFCRIPSRAYRIVKCFTKETRPANQPVAGRRDFTKAVQNNAVYKERSYNTHYKTHVPEIRLRLPASGRTIERKSPPRVALLESSSLERPETTGQPVRTILLGDSMFERFKTTGELYHSCNTV